MSQKAPEIRIVDAWLFRQVVSTQLNELHGKGESLASDEWYEKRADSYRKEWQKYEKKVLDAMMRIVGTTFHQNVIDVYVAPWIRPFSDPLMIGVVDSADLTIDTITHELLHRLFTDNTSKEVEGKKLKVWQEMFGDNHSFTTLVHIPVHSVQKQIMLDVLNEERRFKRDMKNCEKNGATDYVKAWEYVNDNDYKKINKRLREYYSALK